LVQEASLENVTVRRANKNDLSAIQQCLEPFVTQGKILARSLKDLAEQVDEYFVAEVEGKVVGCAVLEVYSAKLSEIRSLAVNEGAQRSGIGKRLVDACIERARNENILEVMAISSNEEFFISCGFDFTLPGEKKALFFMP
jgi:amino-acid N-acetyltransferase